MKENFSAYMNLNRIEFIVTYQCTGKCRHCSVADKLGRTDSPQYANPDKAAEAVEKLCELFGISSVMTFGGEPLLYPDAVCAIHAKASERGIKTRQLITNGYYTKNPKQRTETALRLARSGVNQILISIDAFHQETIPWEDVYAFARAVKDAGIPDVRLHPAWVVNESHDNAYNAETRQLLIRFTDLDIPVSKGNNIVMSGNAVRYLAGFYEKPSLDLSETCGAMPYTEPLTNITALSIEPNGDVAICDFVIGNIIKEDIADIISRYDPHRNDCMRAILTGGAAALLDYAARLGIAVDPAKYYSVCDLCRAVTGQLHKAAE
jgi:MoaA/NifB/PqqE/SkfB family radical SAM enzyme